MFLGAVAVYRPCLVIVASRSSATVAEDIRSRAVVAAMRSGAGVAGKPAAQGFVAADRGVVLAAEQGTQLGWGFVHTRQHQTGVESGLAMAAGAVYLDPY